MASKQKVKKKATKLAEQAETKDDERPGSAHSQISVKEAKSEYQSDNTEGEKFRQDEIKQENDKNEQEEKKNKPESSSSSEKSKEKKTAKKKENKGEKKEAPGTPMKYKQKKTESENPKLKPEKRTPSPARSLSPSEVQRTPSPYRKNKVEPTLAEGGNMGSSASLKSASTIREAWTDHSDMGSMAVFQAISSTDSSVINLQEAAAVKQEKIDKRDTVSLMSRDNKEDEIAKNAYIPYLYARKCIAKVMDDLTNMKANHIRIVGDIQTQYKEIEDETQSQFNIFVFCLRNQYSEKVKTFKQVIGVHRSELQSKEEYWNEMLASLAERNNRLLKSKKMLLVQNKVEIERLEKEMEELRRDLTQQVDKANAALLSVEKGRGLEDELKVVRGELETEKLEVTRLQAQLAASAVVTATAVATTHKDEEVVVTETAMPVMAAVPVSDREKDKMSQERGEIDEERQKMVDERKLMEEDRLKFDEERNKWLAEVAALQAGLALQTKESAEWKAKYTGMKSQLEDSATLHAKYKALENQYAALAAIVAASDTSKELAQENAKKTEIDKEMMKEERQKVEEDIAKWEADFVQQSGRGPTEDDKSDSVKEMYVQKEELDTMVVSLEQKLTTFEKVEKGKVPDPPEVAPVPVTVKDPEVQTIEVKVPDPMIVGQLKEAHDDIAQLRLQIAELQAENTRQNTQITQKNEELSRQRDRITELEREVAALKTAAVGVAAVGVNSEELEALKKENRELKKDMKKLLKKLEKLEEKPDPTADPEDRMKMLDGKVTNLEEKITDLESDNEALLEDNEKLATDKQKLLEQIAGLQQNLITAETDISVSAGAPVVAAVPVPMASAADGKEECSVPGHADLIEQLEIKTQELIEKDAKLQEQEQRIAEKIQEIEKQREESKSMRNDMLKMTKQHAKLQQQLKQLEDFEKTKKLLEAVAIYVHEIHGDIPEASNQVVTKLTAEAEVANNAKAPYDSNKKAVEAWEQKFTMKHGRASSAKDRDQEGVKLYAALEESKAAWEEKKIHVEALNIMRTGDYKPAARRESVSLEVIEEESAVEQIEHQMSALDNKVADLEAENDSLKTERSETQAKMRELEAKLEEARKQAELQASLAMGMESDELSEQITKLQCQVSGLDAALLQEKTAHSNTKDELDNLRKQMEIAKEEMTNERAELKAKMDSKNKSAKTVLKALEEEIEKVKARNEELERERLSNLPVDAANEIKNLQTKLSALEKEKSSSGQVTANLQAQITELQAKVDSSSKNLENQRAANRDLEAKLKNGKTEKDKAVREAVAQVEKREQQRANEDKKRIAALEKRIKQLEAASSKSDTAVVIPAGGKSGDVKALRDQMVNVKRENNDLNARIKQLEMELKRGGGVAAVGVSVEEKNQQKRNEKILKELEKKYEIEKKKTERLDDNLKTTEEELKVTKKDLDEKDKELKKTVAELTSLGVAAKQGVEAAAKVKSLETENKKLTDENKTLTENYNSERVLRRKYYNMVEDMKGKIRVYCRARPLSGSERERGSVSVLKSPDEYCIQVESQRGTKEFQFDQVFMEDSSQEKIFEDTNNLIQSAMDGYNVCIFAYGQTGSGKTFTMIGDSSGQFPGIAPRAFNRIFELAQELKSKFQITVTSYMMELYNDRLIDLFAKPGSSDDEKMEIKKDKKGMVYVQGAMVKEAHNAKELFALFEEGSKNRHTASTKMNAESSRSHLVIGVMMEGVNKSTGQVIKGKLSLVDLAGSERVGKTGATAEQLKEAMSINKSLSALGDVISALSSDQQFIPYRNNKLTMLMQDSLGGNAKTLMFVNISPADYNQDETVISLMYASRVKLITNDASKNADNKEIARLKAVIAKLKKGEAVDEDVDA